MVAHRVPSSICSTIDPLWDALLYIHDITIMLECICVDSEYIWWISDECHLVIDSDCQLWDSPQSVSGSVSMMFSEPPVLDSPWFLMVLVRVSVYMINTVSGTITIAWLVPGDASRSRLYPACFQVVTPKITFYRSYPQRRNRRIPPLSGLIHHKMWISQWYYAIHNNPLWITLLMGIIPNKYHPLNDNHSH